MQLGKLFAPIVLAVVGAASVAAQSPETLQVTVPFPFTVNGVYMPAGAYSISRSGAENSALLAMRRGDSGHTLFFAGTSASLGGAAAQSSLVFRHEGSDYSLADIWWGGYSSGVQLAPPKESAATAALHKPEVMVVVYR
ncbi:MAG TPA: hypothetical protein VN893_13885 [Bryobacteraceae bacterium]|nr:hypothetical protein [Bryobacteraceae bacterium]